MITSRLLTVAFTSLCLTGVALAEPVLRGDVSVHDDIVTVGDLFTNAGELADRAIFRSPQLGTAGTVTLPEIAGAATRVGLTHYSTGNHRSVAVQRPATEIGSDLLVRLMADDLRDRGTLDSRMTLSARFDGGYQPALADDIATPAELLSLRHRPADGGFTARFAIAGHDHPLDLTGTLAVLVEVPHLTRRLDAGSVLSASDIEMRRVPLRQARAVEFIAPSELVGKALKSRSELGMPIAANDVTEPVMVSRNEPVTVYLRSGPMTLTVRGQALGSAAEGQPVQVLNLNTNRVIHTTAIAPGAVEVDNDPVEMAGL